MTDERSETKSEGTLPLGEVERLVALLRESGVGEIRVKSGDVEISVRAGSEIPAMREVIAAGAPALAPAVVPEASEVLVARGEAKGEGELHVLRSPVVGTFYRSAAPGEGAYVEVGDRVAQGQTLCIVEAMKLMNEIPSDITGEVVEVLAENARGVEYDQPLFRIRPES